MKIERKQALDIAKRFALSQYEDSYWPLNIDDISIKLSEGGYGADYLDLSGKYWSVIISTRSDDPSVAAMNPDHVMVLVDSESGEAKWFPVM